MTQEELIAAEVPIEKFALLSKEDLITYLKLEQDFRIQLQRRVAKLEALNEELKQRSLCIEENYITIKNELYGKSSERRPTQKDDGEGREKKKSIRVLLPSER